MLKTFDELYQLDISQYKEQTSTFDGSKQKLDYIPWVNVIKLLRENGAESVTYGNYYNNEGHSVFLVEGKCPEVHIWVQIDKDKYELSYPIMVGNGTVSLEKLRPVNIHKSTQRAFAKCVAINTGLGLKLWEKEEEEKTDDLSVHNIFKIKERFEQKLSAVMEKGMSYPDILREFRMNEKQMGSTIGFFEAINRYEKKLDELIKNDYK